eukprot:6526149-Lingulodinium_polyedra.AAC.1
MDEGFVGMAVVWHLAYHLRARVICVGDIFHRAWNNAKFAVSQADLWWVIVLATLIFNLCHGPWAGASSFEAGAEDYYGKAQVANPLWQQLCLAILRGFDRPEQSSLEQQAE